MLSLTPTGRPCSYPLVTLLSPTRRRAVRKVPGRVIRKMEAELFSGQPSCALYPLLFFIKIIRFPPITTLLSGPDPKSQQALPLFLPPTYH